MAEIILVEDEAVMRKALARNLRGHGHNPQTVTTAEEGLRLIEGGAPDLLITDFRLPGMSGYELLRKIKRTRPELPVVVITAHGTIEDAVAAMRDGAADYLRKPIDLDELRLVIDRCLEREGLQRELSYYRTRQMADLDLDGIVGSSTAVARLRELVERVARLEKKGGAGPTILLSGETGTGKGLIARAIHKSSPRAEAPLIEVNCTAIPEHLLEAELMGYDKGAFTDATASKPGLFEAAETGTIFFDEIGHMSPSLQAKLLKVVEERRVRRLGSTRDRATRCTVITATNRDLEKLVAAGEFREDLFHRINVVKVTLPPLRERDDDVLELARYFLRMHAADYGVEPPRLTEGAKKILRVYSWPGNVRELSHAIERAIVLDTHGTIHAPDLALLTGSASPRGVAISDRSNVEVDFSSGPISLETVELELLRKALDHADGNKAEAGRLLGLSRDTFRYRWAKYPAEERGSD